MPPKKDEIIKKQNIEVSVWKLNRELLHSYVRSHIKKIKDEAKCNPEFDEKELKYLFLDIIIDIGVGFEIYLGRFGTDYFFRILDNLKMMAVDSKIALQNINSNKKGGRKNGREYNKSSYRVNR
ncbi:MAG: hypothetical protein MUC80_00495 [Candidatus Thermoplasmatota archaeon]|jgi:hypothetical protein|nr:hypothetical protein [Candidatus Thermoplasmatota archaeon]